MTDYPDQFDETFLDYARRALEMAGIETDPQLKESKPVLHSIAHAISETGHLYRAARQLCPQSHAHWEQGEFFKVALRAAIWDLQFGAIRNYAQFEFLYSRLLSDAATPFLRSLFAAALLSPNLDSDWARAVLRTIPPFEPGD